MITNPDILKSDFLQATKPGSSQQGPLQLPRLDLGHCVLLQISKLMKIICAFLKVMKVGVYMRVFLLTVSLFIGSISYADKRPTNASFDFCKRNSEVVRPVELELEKDCSLISENDLKRILNLEIKIYFGFPDYHDFAEGDLDGFSSLKHLSIRDDYGQIPEKLFNDLTQLESLNLTGINLSSLPKNIFSNLYALISLDLSSEKLVLQDGLFDHLKNLKSLNLRTAPEELPPALFRNNSQLTHVVLDYNNYSSLPDGIFNGLQLLRFIDLKNNHLTSLPEGIFNGLSSLEDIRLSHNPLMNISSTLFLNLDSLSVIDLEGTGISELPAEIFKGLRSLRLVDLSHNNLSHLDPSLFHDSGIRFLDLNENQLKSIPNDIFYGLTELSRINLKNNQLTSFDANILKDQLRIGYLNLIGNSLQEGDKQKLINRNPKIQELYF